MNSSQRKLLQALEQALTSKPIEQVTIVELLRLAHLSRATFYRQFASKDDFFRWVLDYYLQNLAYAKLHDVQTPAQFYDHYFNYIYEHRLMFKTFTNAFIWPQFNQRITENALREYHQFLNAHSINKKANAIVANFIVSAHVGVVIRWLHESPLTPPDVMSALVTKMTTSALKAAGFDLAAMFPWEKAVPDAN